MNGSPGSHIDSRESTLLTLLHDVLPFIPWGHDESAPIGKCAGQHVRLWPKSIKYNLIILKNKNQNYAFLIYLRHKGVVYFKCFTKKMYLKYPKWSQSACICTDIWKDSCSYGSDHQGRPVAGFPHGRLTPTVFVSCKPYWTVTRSGFNFFFLRNYDYG